MLPHLQGCGYGRALIAAAYDLALQRDAIDLTVSGTVTRQGSMVYVLFRGFSWVFGSLGAVVDCL